MSNSRVLSAVFFGFSLWAAAAQAQTIAVVPLATGLDSPTFVTHAGDGSGRLFITLLDGRILIHDGCQMLATPFLDIRSLVLAGGEQGLLSMAFHPNYPATPYFWVNYTRQNDGATVIARYRVSAGNPNVADAASAVTLLVIPQPFSNHNGGQLQFGLDGYLYIGMGDGGSGGDPFCNAQNNNTLLGRMLRIDVNQNFNTPPFYGVPPGNPLNIGPPETWAKGLRNPWRFSFDRTTGDLFIGDVGQNAIEEVNFQAAGAAGGRNYGWKVMEGTQCTGDSSSCTSAPACNAPGLTLPIIQYSHGNGCAVVGGYRYRGTQIPALAGTYVYADLCAGEIRGATLSGNVWSSTVLLDPGFSQISSFGEDETGELYVTDYSSSGTVYRIVAPNPQADLFITKTDNQSTVIAGSPVAYTIAVGNNGPRTAAAATVADTFPASLQNVNWTCSSSGASSCCSVSSGSNNINRQVTLAPGGTVTFTATATLNANATGTLSNTATVTVPSGISDPNASNNSATDTDTIVPIVNLSITKTNGQTTATPGAPRTYTIVASNAGPAPAPGATLVDTLPAALTAATWTCSASPGSSCGAASGSGNINQTVNLAVGGTVTYTLNATVAANPSGLVNTATVAAPSGTIDPNLLDNSATDEDLLLCFADRLVSADGRVTHHVAGAGSTTWFLSQLKSGSSYSLELKNTSGDSTPPGALTVFSGADGCSGTSTLVARDTVNIEPAGGAATRRVSFTVANTGNQHRARLVNGSGVSIGHTLSWSETTLYAAAWSTNGSFDTYYSFQNTTGASLSGTLTLFDTVGNVVATIPVTVPAGQTVSTNTSAQAVTRNRTGTARFSHDGPPGAVLAEAAVANFTISPAYVQPVKFVSVREAR